MRAPRTFHPLLCNAGKERSLVSPTGARVLRDNAHVSPNDEVARLLVTAEIIDQFRHYCPRLEESLEIEYQRVIHRVSRQMRVPSIAQLSENDSAPPSDGKLDLDIPVSAYPKREPASSSEDPDTRLSYRVTDTNGKLLNTYSLTETESILIDVLWARWAFLLSHLRQSNMLRGPSQQEWDGGSLYEHLRQFPGAPPDCADELLGEMGNIVRPMLQDPSSWDTDETIQYFQGLCRELIARSFVIVRFEGISPGSRITVCWEESRGPTRLETSSRSRSLAYRLMRQDSRIGQGEMPDRVAFRTSLPTSTQSYHFRTLLPKDYILRGLTYHHDDSPGTPRGQAVINGPEVPTLDPEIHVHERVPDNGRAVSDLAIDLEFSEMPTVSLSAAFGSIGFLIGIALVMAYACWFGANFSSPTEPGTILGAITAASIAFSVTQHSKARIFTTHRSSVLLFWLMPFVTSSVTAFVLLRLAHHSPASPPCAGSSCSDFYFVDYGSSFGLWWLRLNVFAMVSAAVVAIRCLSQRQKAVRTMVDWLRGGASWGGESPTPSLMWRVLAALLSIGTSRESGRRKVVVVMRWLWTLAKRRFRRGYFDDQQIGTYQSGWDSPMASLRSDVLGGMTVAEGIQLRRQGAQDAVVRMAVVA